MAALQTIIVGVLMLSALVVIHEFGHYAASKAFGVRVSEFMVGLPGPHIKLFKKGGTTFGITAYLLGGYARVAGMDPTPEDPLLATALGYAYREGTTDAEHLAWYLTTRGLVKYPSNDEERRKVLERADDMLTTLEGWASLEPDESAIAKQAKRDAEAADKVFWPRYCAPEAPKQGLLSGQPRAVADDAALLDEQRRGTYNALSVPKRLVILCAGPLMNLATALVILLLVLCVNGVYRTSTSVYELVDGGGAQAAGMVAGDVITQIGDYPIAVYEDIGSALSNYAPGDSVEVKWTRDGAEMSAPVVLQAGEDG